jgi:hypothetical protein
MQYDATTAALTTALAEVKEHASEDGTLDRSAASRIFGRVLIEQLRAEPIEGAIRDLQRELIWCPSWNLIKRRSLIRRIRYLRQATADDLVRPRSKAFERMLEMLSTRNS